MPSPVRNKITCLFAAEAYVSIASLTSNGNREIVGFRNFSDSNSKMFIFLQIFQCVT